MKEKRKVRFKFFKQKRLDFYWYIDTSVEGKVCKCFIIDGKLEPVDKFNKSIGNYFKTKKQADAALLKLKNENKL